MDVVIPYRPRPLQKQLHLDGTRFVVACLHRRFGKTVFAVNQLIRAVTNTNLPYARGHYIAPFLKQAKSVAWDYLQQFSRPIPGMDYNQNELRADFPNGGRVELCGAENFDKHRGKYSDFVVMDEVAQMPPAAWREVFRPALSDRLGRALFIGTPKGANFFKDLHDRAGGLEGWTSYHMTAEQTGVIIPEELEALKREMTPEEYDQEMNCNFEAANVGSFYAEEMAALRAENRIIDVPHDEALKVTTAWDLGRVDSTVVTYWQTAGAQIRCIDVDDFKSKSIPYMVRSVLGRAFKYEEHIAPWDIEVTELGPGKTRFEQAKDLGLTFKIAPRQPSVDDGINAVKVMLGRCWFDLIKCHDLIEALRQYHRSYDEIRRVYSPKPVHDWSSDFADSVRYFAIAAGTRRGDWSKPLDYSGVNKHG